MKIFGSGVTKEDRGYFGKRKCIFCGELVDVSLVILSAKFYFLFLPVHTFNRKALLVCKKCGACLEMSDSLWAYYQTYLNRRLTEGETNEVILTIKKIESELNKENLSLDLKNETMMNLMLEKLNKKYGKKEGLEEIISVYLA